MSAPLSTAVRDLAAMDPDDPVLRAGVAASVRTLTEGITWQARRCDDPDMTRKHRARLLAALGAMADALAVEERGADVGTYVGQTAGVSC